MDLQAILASRRQDPTIHIPFEIHELILDYFSIPAPSAWDDRDSPQSAENRATLRAYSMVSRSFCATAHSRLFSSLVLRVKAFSRIRNARLVALAIRRFVAILQDSLNFPNLGMIYHIRSFALIIQIDCNSSQAYNFLRDATIHRIVDVLHGPDHGVESLALDIGYGKLEYTEITIKHDLLFSFQNIIRSSNLKHLRLNGLLGLPRTLFHGANLKNLELYNTELEYDGNTFDVPLITTMESIGVDESFWLVDILHSGNDSIGTPSRYQAAFVELKSLYFVAHLVRRIPNAINIAVNAANTIRTLHIHLFGEWLEQRFDIPHSSSEPIYPFHLLPRLSSLRLSSKNIGLGWDDVICPFRYILESCTIPQSLKVLTVETMPWGRFMSRYSHLHDLDEWLAMDSVLVRPMFNAVPQIRIIIEYPVHSDEHGVWQKNNIEDFLLLDALPSFSKLRRGGSLPCFGVIMKRHVDKSSRHQNGNHLESKEVTLKCGGRKELGIP